MEAKAYIINPYKEVKDKIFINQIKLAGHEKDLKRIIDLSGPKGVQAQQYDSVLGSGKIENVNDLYNLIIETKTAIENLKKQLNDLKQTKKQIEENFIRSCLNDTEKRIFLLKQNKTRFSYDDIAYKLNITEGYVKVVVSNINKKMAEWVKNLQKNEFIY